MPKAPHHSGTYHVRSAAIRAAAYADPTTRCWRCKRTLQEARRYKPKDKWTAGHLYDGDPDSPLLPEHASCNYAAGGRRRHELARARRRTELTW